MPASRRWTTPVVVAGLVVAVLLIFWLFTQRGQNGAGAPQAQGQATSEPATAPAAPTESAATATAELPEATPTVEATATISGPAYDNPVYDEDFPDPFVLRVDETYYAFGTNTNDCQTNVQTLQSTNLTEWEFVGDALPDLPEWAVEGECLTWAPGVLQRGERFILYYTTRYEEIGRQCISIATSDSPTGPYADESTEPFICQGDLGGSIDPNPFVDEDGTTYILWKNDGNCCGLDVWLWSQQLSEDGLSLVGEPAQLIERNQGWERPLIENPAMWKHEDTYYLLYSANWWESHQYAVGYAVCESVQGPCEKPQNGPIFQFAPPVMGPGGEALFTDTEGNLWMVYHGWTAPNVTYGSGGERAMRIDPVTFEDGKPVIRGPTDAPQPLP